jgi:hypothetical protein
MLEPIQLRRIAHAEVYKTRQTLCPPAEKIVR